MVRLFGTKHVLSIISFIIYVACSIAFSAVFGILNSATLWIGLFFLAISFIAIFVGLAMSFKVTTPAFFPLIDKPLFLLFFIEYIVYTVFLVINLIVKEAFPHLLNLIQLPILIIFVSWILSIYARAKYVGDQVKEEKATVKMQSSVYSLIDKNSSLKYSFHVTDAIDGLVDTIRTMGIDSNPNACQIYSQIFDSINDLNDYMRQNENETKIIFQIKKIEKLIELRREENRRF